MAVKKTKNNPTKTDILVMVKQMKKIPMEVKMVSKKMTPMKETSMKRKVNPKDSMVIVTPPKKISGNLRRRRRGG